VSKAERQARKKERRKRRQALETIRALAAEPAPPMLVVTSRTEGLYDTVAWVAWTKPANSWSFNLFKLDP
jgi:hypothetical protein